MLIIRLQRTGSRNKPSYRIVLAQSERPVNKKFLEVLGHYNPKTKIFGIKNEERLNFWMNHKVKISPTVHNLLIEKKLMAGDKIKVWSAKSKPAEIAKNEAEFESVKTEILPQPVSEEKPEVKAELT